MRRPEDRKERRHHQVAELLRTEVSHILWRDVKDPRLGHLSITEVDLKPDLRSAVIYVSRLPEGENPAELSPEEIKNLEAGLQSASHFVYEHLKRRLIMKVIPSLRFVFDLRWKNAARIWGLTSGSAL